MRKIRGIVIREQQTGESSKQIVVLAKEMGKVRLSARGAKNTKSRLLAGTQLFCYCDFTVYEGRGFLSVTQADLIESFYALRNDVEVLAQAVYLAELVDSTCPAGMEHDNILKLLLYTMQVMAKGYLPPKLAGRIFEMKYLQYSGFLASADCVTCGEQAQYFDQKEATFYCKQHRSREAVLLSRAVVQALDYVLEEEGKKLFAFRLSPEALKQLDAVLRQYLQMHVGVDLKSRRFAVDI
ncbi:MAG TPA: DNA repair protein RecO [Candidatus Anaerotignum merdipullorum]|nr:DNA repair protein RecO [Candidatus Anaerotignum merdipullorum]